MRLHGIWILEDEVIPKGRLFLWAEQINPRLPTKSEKTNTHPYALSPTEILKYLKVYATAYKEVLLLPSNPLFPIPSSFTDVDTGNKAILKEWRTPGVVIKEDGILRFLTLLDESALRQEQILLGEDIIFLSQVAKFGIELLARQRFLPWLKYSEDKRLICFWQPVFINEEEKRLFSHFKSSMPEAVRCVVSHKTPSTRERLILHFLTVLINHTIRSFIDYN